MDNSSKDQPAPPVNPEKSAVNVLPPELNTVQNSIAIRRAKFTSRIGLALLVASVPITISPWFIDIALAKLVCGGYLTRQCHWGIFPLNIFVSVPLAALFFVTGPVVMLLGRHKRLRVLRDFSS